MNRSLLTRLCTPPVSELKNFTPVPLRLIVGYGFIAHGYTKIAKGPGHFFLILNALGVPAPHIMGWATILILILGGFAVFAGAFISIVSMPMIAVLLVAMVRVHLRYGFSSIKLIGVTSSGPQFGPPGVEVALVYVACLTALLIGGSGPFSIDGLLAKSIASRTLPVQPSRSGSRVKEIGSGQEGLNF